MESYQLSGKVDVVWETKKVSEKFRKREFVVIVNSSTVSGTFVDYIKLQLVQDKCELLDGVYPGDMVVVRWALAGRRWGKKPEEKYFTNVECLEITVVTRGDGVGASDSIEDELPLEPEDTIFDVPKTESIPDEGVDDLPF